MTKKYWVGITGGSPIVGDNFFVADFLQTCKVDSLFIDKNVFDGIGDIGSLNENDLPDYVHDLGEGKITLITYGDFQYKSRLLISYTPLCLNSKPCSEP